jgi:hypothetical protein
MGEGRRNTMVGWWWYHGNDHWITRTNFEFGEDIAISTYKNALKDNLEYSNAKQRHLLNNHLSILKLTET